MSQYLPPPDTGLNVIHADPGLLVVDKPAGLLSVPGRGEDKQDCLVARVQARFPEALAVHRLDMSTSGLLLLARGEEMHRQLSRLFRDREVDKRYVALLDGCLEQAAGEVDLPLICDWPNRPRQKVDFDIGKRSLTRFVLLDIDQDKNTSRVELEPVTGRSHQLRVHMAALGHPILGDELYGTDDDPRTDRLTLHATELSFVHPHTGSKMHFRSPPPF